MASKKQVTLIYLCVEFLSYISLIFAATILKDNYEFMVPSHANVGHIVTKLGCSDSEVSIQTNRNPSEVDELFNKLFYIDKHGNLVVRSDLSHSQGQYFIVSVLSKRNCFDNVAFKRTLGIFISNSNEYLQLEKPIFKGFLPKTIKPGHFIDGLESVIPDSKISCTLIGENSELFEIVSTGVQLRSILPEKSVSYYFILQCSDGHTHGHSGIHINSHNPSLLKNRQKYMVNVFSQESENIPHHRYRRADTLPHLRHKRADTVVKTLSVTEGTTDVLTLDSPQTGTLSWTISDDTNTFQINSNGKLSVKAGSKLDYDYGARQYTVAVQVKSSDGQTLLRTYQVDITVTDLNDERPVITNHPKPFQDTVEFSVSPGKQVYQLKAFDIDTNSDVKFYIEGTNDDFSLNEDNGWIATKRILKQNTNYTVRVYAEDKAATATQRSDIETVSIFTGFLNPQFNESSYTARVPENNQAAQTFSTFAPDGHESLVYAKNFQKNLGGNTVYTVYSGNTISPLFNIDNTGHLVTLSTLDYEKDGGDTKSFSLTIQALDTHSQRTSTVPLTVFLEDVNEFDPIFTLSTYTAEVREDLAIGSAVETVTATDADLNSKLTFSVTPSAPFRVQSLTTITGQRQTTATGQIQVNRTLDYDQQPGHQYDFNVFVTDNGADPKTKKAKVLIKLINVNDEHPTFQDTDMVTTIKDNILPGSNVYLVQAVDLDGDDVTYSFENGLVDKDIFQIQSDSGQISYRTGVTIPSNVDKYVLTVLAKDDGSCCSQSSTRTRLTSTSSVTINIVSEINNKPDFPQCNTYQPSVMENKPIGTSVITVSAVDNDRGDNGAVEYYAVPDPNRPQYFTINQTTGEVSTIAEIDREILASQYLFFTVRVIDKGKPRLDAYCTFQISVADDNDNVPEFSANNFKGSVQKTAAVDTSVMSVKATDKDIGVNAEVIYAEVQTTNYFKINRDTGEISVASSLDSVDAGTSVTFTINATDKGQPPKSSSPVTIEITVTQDGGDGDKPPVWTNANPVFQVPESENKDYLVGSLTARSADNDDSVAIKFTLISKGQAVDQVPPFYINIVNNTVNIKLLEELDYEKVKEYRNYLQLRALVNLASGSQVYTDVFPLIEVLDKNDNIPTFAGRDATSTYIEGSILENTDPPATVLTVAATDGDISSRYRNFTYSLLPGPNAVNFTINSTTGVVSTASRFDREAIPLRYLLLGVKVEDGFPSSRPGITGSNSATATVRVTIADVNDNAPYFEQNIYRADVKEDAFISSVITTIEAKDLDEATFRYSIKSISPNPGTVLFNMKTQQKQGVIVVAGNIDYETGAHAYNLTVEVDDGLFKASTTVEISIIDVNDNAPVFHPSSYIITDVVEETEYSPSSPRYLLTANATDPDTFRDKGMEYRISVEDPAIRSMFEINSNTGILNLISKLDRDRPNGREVFQFNLLAVDEPGETNRLTGYATVQIKPIDINDNAPVFIPINPVGSVLENSPVGTPVMTVVAEDYDAGDNAKFVFEMIGASLPFSAFRIDDKGKVFTTVSNLDRETNATFTFRVRATDQAPNLNDRLSSEATVTINIKDENDNVPVFPQDVYQVTIPETHSGTIIILSAKDPDIDDTFTYSLNQDAYRHFTMTTQGRQGFLAIYNGSNPDYENPNERFFNLTATVSDGIHQDTTNIQITIEDVNDETPIFTEKTYTANLKEGPETPIGTEIRTFTATDRDGGVNGQFRYYISFNPIDQEPRKYFTLEDFVDSNGNPSTRVKLAKLLDRETISQHIVYILAIDSGYPELTGTATLTVNVIDINDNYPRIRTPYVTIMEGSPVNTLVTTLLADDPDTPDPNGDKFGFAAIPCLSSDSDAPQCKFTVTPSDALDSGKGGAFVRSKEVFDRETQKYYYLPVLMWDHNRPGESGMTGTNTLTIEIGDINDNAHGPGTQNILVYNYKGMFKNIKIGAVNYNDPDDNDIGDKTFTGPKSYQDLFSVDVQSGMITMIHNIPSGTFTFDVDVYDSVFKNTAASSVTVTVKDLPEEAPYRSGSIRIKGTTPEKFIKPGTGSDKKSPYDKYRQHLSKSLGTSINNVDITTVLSPETDVTDVRFAAHGSPYYSATKMNAAILRDKSGFQAVTGGTIEMINIDECLHETCESGCYNYLNVTGEPSLVNIRGNSIVGVEAFVQGQCGCRVPVSDKECHATYCYNGGTCQKDYWNVISCTCPAGFDGPRCQTTRHNFDGTGYALFKPLVQCKNSETSIEFITTHDNGLILYTGPVSDNSEHSDYLALELANGFPRLKIDHGSGLQTLSLNSPSLNGGEKLSDGKWHHINIMRRGKLVTMTVDYCRDIQPPSNSDAIVDDRSICEVSKSTPGENMFLNVNAPLQMGGRYTPLPNLPTGIITSRFNGCVRNLKHNNELYDLSDTFPGSTTGCRPEDNACNKNSINLRKKCGDHGDCQITDITDGTTICVCHSGWRGDNCSTETTIKDLNTTDSYMDWMLRSAFQGSLSQWQTDVHVMYRTRDTDGVIFHISSTIKAEFIRLEIQSNLLQVLYNLGDGNHAVSLDKVVASDGQWHAIRIKRRGKFLSLSMDNGEGIHYSDTQGPDNGHHLLEIRSNQIYAGAGLDYDQNPTSIIKDLNSTCLRDIRLSNSWFPMTFGENADNTKIQLNTAEKTKDDCVRNDCNNANCGVNFTCRPLWEAFECVCKLHYVKSGPNKCIPIDYCGLYTPCHPAATCTNNPANIDYGYDCHCHSGWTGRTCYQAEQVAEDTSSALLPILIPILVILLLIILIVGFVLWWKCRTTEDVLIEDEKEDYDVRENVMDYDEEGAGEDDYEGHITGLGRLPDSSHFDKPVTVNPLNRSSAPPPGGPGIGDFIGDRLDDANDDQGAPPYDTLKEFDYEGGGSDAGSLSSLNTSTSGGDQDYDYLNEWGPKFAKLADMYNNPNYEDSD